MAACHRSGVFAFLCQPFWQICYSGNAFDPADTEHARSMKLVENAAERIAYLNICEDEMNNQMNIIIK